MESASGDHGGGGGGSGGNDGGDDERNRNAAADDKEDATTAAAASSTSDNDGEKEEVVAEEDATASDAHHEPSQQEPPPTNNNNDDSSVSMSMSVSSIRTVYERVVEWIRDTPVTPELDTVTTDEKLRLYGLYRHVLACQQKDDAGNEDADGEVADEAPSVFFVKAHAKHRAWRACAAQGLTAAEAMEEYVNIAASQDNWLGRKCDDLLQQHYGARAATATEDDINSNREGKPRGGAATATKPGTNRVVEMRAPATTTTKVEDGTTNTASTAASLLGNNWLGIRPLVPRGRLDISPSDLAYAAYQASGFGGSTSNRRYDQLESSMVTLWNNPGGGGSDRRKSVSEPASGGSSSSVVVGFSVRSLLDLYLIARQYPKGSEVVVTPPINVPGMVHVLEHHGLKVVGVDLPPPPTSGDSNSNNSINTPPDDDCVTVLKVDIEAVEKAVTSRTVAILVVHPFGTIAANDEEMAELRAVATKRDVHLLEDCAECFTGLGAGCYRGSPHADLSFFSFGLIKTATALGGGVAVVAKDKDSDLAERMNRLQRSPVYRRQSAWSFLWRIVIGFALRCIAGSPLLYGLISLLCCRLGLDFDSTVTSSLRSFSSSHSGRTDQRIRHLRQMPCPALLALLYRRLQQSRTRSASILARLHRCRRLTEILKADAPGMVAHVDNQSHNSTCYWLYPVLSKHPADLCRRLHRSGFDSTRGSSQLLCIGTPEECPRASTLMERIVYLPVSSQPLSDSDLRRLAKKLVEAEQHTNPCQPRDSNPSKERGFSSWVVIGLSASAFFLPVVIFASWSLFELIQWFLLFPMTAFCLSLLVVSHVLRWSIADFYIDSSACFARYNAMLSRRRDNETEAGGETPAVGSMGTIISSIKPLRMPSCQTDTADEPRKVILTGATGFIGSLLLRDLLLHREALALSQVLVLCRPKRGISAEDRILKLLNTQQFSFLSQDEKRSLVKVIVGDVTRPNAGLSENDLDLIRQDASITHVFHCAASISFTQTLPDAARSNISSALYLQKLTSLLPAKNSQFVHVSTAFVHGSTLGTESCPLTELLFPLGDYEPSRLYSSMLDTQFYASRAMNELGFHNTYTFSKCVSEHLLSQNTDVDTVIFRPTIVGPSLESPHEGWAGSRPSTLVAASCLYLAYQWNLWSFGGQRVPCIPVDVVTRFILAKSFAGQVSDPSSSDEASSSDGSYEKISRYDSSSDESEGGGGSTTNGKRPSANRIYNVAWDTTSPPSTGFTWLEYAVAVTQMGSVMGYFSRPTAYIGLLVTARILPLLSLSTDQFGRLHGILVEVPFRAIQRMYRLLYQKDSSLLNKLASFLDLPLLFHPFMNNAFHFRSELVAPPVLDGSRYLFSCTAASNMFMERVKGPRIAVAATKKQLTPYCVPREESGVGFLRVGGSSHQVDILDVWWALTQPRGNLFIRLAAWIMIKAFRATCTEITVDAVSFAAVASSLQAQGGRVRVVLAPTHRSFFDFIILGFVLFSIPELQLDLPFIAAADDFEKLPIIGFLARLAGAFFVQRGRKREDPRLREKLRAIKGDNRARCPVIEVFIEGARSRDRRFLEPKTGFLRCLQEEGGDFLLIVPVTVNYERVPEQESLSIEACSGSRNSMSVIGLFTWLVKAARGKISLGRIHLAACDPIVTSNQQAVTDLADLIQRRQHKQLYISSYHVDALSRLLSPLESDKVWKGLSKLGCKLWPSSASATEYPQIRLPADKSELVTIALQASPFLARVFNDSKPEWSSWLSRLSNNEPIRDGLLDDPSVAAITNALSQMFDEADSRTESALRLLKANGFPTPKPDHVLQAALNLEGTAVPMLLQCASVCIRLQDAPTAPEMSAEVGSASIPDHSTRKVLDSEEALGFWGFHDSSFLVKTDRNGSPYVTMQGGRYSLSDRRVTGLLPFIEEETQVRINLLNEAFREAQAKDVTPLQSSRLTQEDVNLLESTIGSGTVSVSADDRIRHGTGHSQEDVFLIRSRQSLRVPDAVVRPASEDGVAELVRLATARSWCLIPFGGGTNVSQSTRCPPLDVEPRPILSVDMKDMARVLWIDEENGLARVEAGITGRALLTELAARGYTVGHEPDSLEFSTVGGWIATKASGMKRAKYGNIEDIVKSVRAVGTGTGTGAAADGGGTDAAAAILQHGREDAPAWGRESTGLDLRDLLLGSEGCLGIVTSAVVRIWPVPEVQDHDGILFADFDVGTSFVRDVSRLGGNMPVTVRLMDNEHFRLGQAMSPEPRSVLESGIKGLMKFLVGKRAGLDWNSVVLVSVTYEGTGEEVHAQKKAMSRLSCRHGGVHLGATAGKAGSDMTFVIAYLRDFALTYHCLGESFETFVPWSKVAVVVRATKECIRREHAARFLPGRPFVGCRATQLYHEGVCLYFYFCMNFENVTDPSGVFAEIERAARREILDHGGSLSHHHGVGKVRSHFLKDVHSPALRASLKAVKRGMDPNNIFGARNGAFADDADDGGSGDDDDNNIDN